jgi:hypothetical protein
MILYEMYEKQGEFLDEWAKHKCTCLAKGSISWDGTFLPKVNHKIVVKLNTGCVQNVVTTWRYRLISGTCHTYPHLDEVHGVLKQKAQGTLFQLYLVSHRLQGDIAQCFSQGGVPYVLQHV